MLTFRGAPGGAGGDGADGSGFASPSSGAEAGSGAYDAPTAPLRAPSPSASPRCSPGEVPSERGEGSGRRRPHTSLGHVNGGSRGSWKVITQQGVPSESSPREERSTAANSRRTAKKKLLEQRMHAQSLADFSHLRLTQRSRRRWHVSQLVVMGTTETISDGSRSGPAGAAARMACSYCLGSCLAVAVSCLHLPGAWR